MKAKAILIVILIILSLVIILQNTQVIDFKFFFWTLTMSRIIWLIAFLIVGVIIGYIMGTARRE